MATLAGTQEPGLVQDPSSQCADCNETIESSVKRCSLTCQIHFICKTCLLLRLDAATSGSMTNQCTLCDSATTSLDAPPVPKIEAPIWIYVDDSNIWIEAKKHASKIRRFKTKEDHRVRIEIGKLTEVVADGRPVAQGFLYGSEPPPVDTVWEKIKQKGWNVNPYRRSRMTGKEKKVDTQLVADVTEKACKTPEKEKSTFVLITGDADAIPAIDVALKYDWNVDVVMWKHAMSADLMKLEKKSENRLKLRYLDDFLEKVTFTNRKFQIAGNDHLIPNLKESGVVLKVNENKFPKRLPSFKWCKKVEAIAQWPFQYYWVDFEKSSSAKNNDLVLFFKRDGKNTFDMEDFISTLDDYLEDLFIVDKPRTYLSYDQSMKGIYSLNEVGRFDYGEAVDPDLDQVYTSNDEGDGPLQLVKYHHRRKKHCYSDRCPYKFNCKFGRSCHYKHTDEEIVFFRENVGKGRAFRKVKPCYHFPNCAKKIEECFYAHGQEDAWCLICCDCKGHFTDHCPDQKKH